VDPIDPDVVRFEPILRFSQRERFFPVEARAFIQKCALARGAEVLVPAGQLTIAALLTHVDQPDLELVLTSVPRTAAERSTLTFNVKFAMARINDLFNRRPNAKISPLGHEFADEAAAATADISLPAVGPAYHFHITRSGDWKAIQYWFLYPYNDWGSARGSMNDHEGDWEMVCIFLRGGIPQTLFLSAHEDGYSGRWGEAASPAVEGGHPIVYVGLGSHAMYPNVGLRHPLGAGTTMADGVDADDPPGGLVIGPGTAHPWAVRTAVAEERWSEYRGTWGAVVQAVPMAGSSGPVGPWTRPNWNNPFPLAGLVAPPQ
jgi:hypothetical protein